jgi:hypothetical protein
MKRPPRIPLRQYKAWETVYHRDMVSKSRRPRLTYGIRRIRTRRNGQMELAL